VSPLFYEDSLGAKLVDALRERGYLDPEAPLRSPGSPAPHKADELVEDPEALQAAEQLVFTEDPQAVYTRVGDDWVPVFGPSKVSGVIDIAGANAAVITMPLAAVGIEFAWYPYPPEQMPSPAYPYSHIVDRPFTLLVPAEDAVEAAALISAVAGSRSQFGVVSTHERVAEAVSSRRTVSWVLLIVLSGLLDLVAIVAFFVARWIYHLIR
jgi:hypothetical protein